MSFLEDRYKYEVKDELFSNCTHTEKEDGECLSCGYNLCWGNKKYFHPDQYKNCDHSYKIYTFMGQKCGDCGLQFKPPHAKQYEDCNHLYMENKNSQNVCLRCGFREEYREKIAVSNKCVHKRFGEINGSIFCPDCGIGDLIVFPPSWYWETQTLKQKVKRSYTLFEPCARGKPSKPEEGEQDYGDEPKPVKKDESEEGDEPEKGEPEEGDEPEEGEQDYGNNSDDDGPEPSCKPKPVKKRRKKIITLQKWMAP